MEEKKKNIGYFVALLGASWVVICVIEWVLIMLSIIGIFLPIKSLFVKQEPAKSNYILEGGCLLSVKYD